MKFVTNTLILSILMGLCGGAQAASNLFRASVNKTERALTIKENKDLALIKSAKGVKSVIPVEVDQLALRDSELQIDIPNGPKLNVRHRAEVTRVGGKWVGRVDKKFDNAKFMVENGNIVVGEIRTLTRVYELTTIAPGKQFLVEIDPRELPPDHSKDYVEPPASAAPSSAVAMNAAAQDSSSNPVITIAVAISPSAAAFLGQASAEGKAKLAIDNFNQAMIDSGEISARAAHAGTMFLTQDYSSDKDALVAISTSVEAARFRDSTNADIVVLIAHYEGSCGRAREIYANARTAFVTVAAKCLVVNHSLAHEIGHLAGMRHNPEKDSALTPYAHGHGYWATYGAYQSGVPVEGTFDCFHTLMSYAIKDFNSEAAKNCPFDPRINLYSSNWKHYLLPKGGNVPIGHPSCCNNAAVMNVEGPRLASFSDTKISDGVSSSLTTIIVNVVAMILYD